MWLQRKEKLLSGVLLGLLVVAWGVLLLPRLFRGSEGGFNVFGVFRIFGFLVPSLRGSRDPMAALSRTSSGMRSLSDRSGGGFSAGDLPGVGRSPSRGLPARRPTSVSSYGAARSRRANKRRRDVFMGLLFSAIGTALFALVPGFSMLWKANIVVDVLLLSYVGLLVSARRPATARSSQSLPGANFRYEASDYLDFARSEA